MLKGEEAEIGETIEELKQERKFAPTIRDGIRLINDLRKGKLDVLFELFPWVRAEFMDYMREIQPVVVTQTAEPPATPAGQSQQAWLEAEQERLEAERKWNEKRLADAEKALDEERKRIEADRAKDQKIMQAKLDRLEQLLLQQGNQPISDTLQPVSSGGGGSPQNSSGPKQLAVQQFAPPTFDDDDDEDFTLNISKDEHSGKQAALNFIHSMQQLHQ